MVDYKELGKKIAQKRINMNLTQEQLAEKLQTSPSYISNIENGVYGISFDRFVEIAKILELSYDYLLSNEIENVDIKIKAEVEEITNTIKKLDEKNQKKAFIYIDNFLNTMMKLEE